MAAAGCSRPQPADRPAQPQSADLLAGHAWQYSIDGGETFSDIPPVMTFDGQKVDLISRITFDVASMEGMAELHLHVKMPWWTPLEMSINDARVETPYAEMIYSVVPGIDPAMLTVGENELAITEGYEKFGDGEDRLPPTTAKLVAMSAEDLAIRTGPVLGAFDGEQFSVTCRTNMLAHVTCVSRSGDSSPEYDYRIVGERGLVHEFVVSKGGMPHEYRLEATVDGVTRSTAWLPVPQWADVSDGDMRFAVAGDVQTVSDVWPTIVEAIIEQQPDFLVFTGDMVANGRHDSSWDAEFLGPARELFAVTPLYPVEGNHEWESPILPDLFYTPAAEGRGLTWAQQVGDVLLIAINGQKDYGEDTANYAWLEATLAESDAKFIFLFSHYPSFGSNRYGGTNEAGVPMDAKTHQAQHVIMPLLAKYNATAMLTGHDHFYERSEPPVGVTAIICGGGGGRLEERRDGWETRNPTSQAYTSQHHYLMFDVVGDTCTMNAYALDGELIDSRTWQARE